MKTLWQKDLRENFKLALVGFAILGLILFHAYHSARNTNTNPLLAEDCLMAATFFCGIFGAVLGWLQTRNEAHRDLWAFLIHRPLTRTEIFAGKAGAGLCLYAFGAGLPLLIFVAAVRLPGHIAAPFEWPMVLPLAAILLAGVAGYFAGLLTGLRQARWFGSKCFGLALAFLASASVLTVQEFWQALGVTLLVIAILAAAVWGAYQSGGFYCGLPPAGKAALILTVLAGSGGVMLLAIAVVVGLVCSPFMHPFQSYSNYVMTREGKICKETWQNGEWKPLVDLAGQPVIDPKTGRPIERAQVSRNASYWIWLSPTDHDRRADASTFRKEDRFYQFMTFVDKDRWYLDRHGKLVGYDGRTRRCLGTIAPDGMPGTETAEPFLPLSSQYYLRDIEDNNLAVRALATARRVYRVDLIARELKPIITIAQNDEIEGCVANNHFVGEAGTNTTRGVLLATRKSLLLVEMGGRLVWQTNEPPNFSEYTHVSIFDLIGTPNLTTTNRFALWFYPDPRLNETTGWKIPEHVEWFAADGAQTYSLNLPELRGTFQDSWPDRVATTLMPPALIIPSQKHFLQFEPLTSCVWDLIGVAAGAWLARRYRFSNGAMAGWLVFILICGIPGLLTLICVQEWPARELCPSCHEFRAVDRAQCEHCAAEFPAPEKNGTEIFAPLVKT